MMNKWSRQAFFTLLEHGFVRVLDAATTFTLVRVLMPSEFGLFSVYQSWAAMLFLFLPSIELNLFREYGHFKEKGTLGVELGAYRLFNFIKLGTACMLVVALAWWPSANGASYPARLALLGLALALPFSHAFYSYMREPLRFEMKQALVALLSMLQRVLLIGALWISATLFRGNAFALLGFGFGAYALTAVLWRFASRRFFEGVAFFSPEFWKRIAQALAGSVLWIHVNGVITQALQTFDVFSLHHFGVPLDEIGRYNLALKAANFFQIIPVALASSFGVYLARQTAQARATREAAFRERKFAVALTLLFTLLCSALLGLGVLVAEPLLGFLAKGKASAAELEQATRYFNWQLAGVLLLCASHPLSTYLSARARLKRIFLWVNVPWFVFSVIAYLWSARFGALYTAQANVAVYAFAVLLLVVHFFGRRAS